MHSSQLHKTCVAALLIAIKYEEIEQPKLRDIIDVCNNIFTHAEIVAIEFNVLSQLQFDIATPSAYRFLERFWHLVYGKYGNRKVFFFAQYIIEITMLEPAFLRYHRSEIAAAALILSSRRLTPQLEILTGEIAVKTGYTASHLTDAVQEIKQFLENLNPVFLTNLSYKFMKLEYG